MKTLWTLALSGAALVVASGAFAFQEQQGGSAAQPAPQASPAVPAEAPSLDLGTQDAPKAQDGTEVSIPGIGKLGVLPKMDFGLELLYGAADQKTLEPAPSNQVDPDDLTVRGSLKHKF